MNILVIGGGGREHTLCWKISQSAHCDKLFAAPGNAGTQTIATNLPIGVTDFDGIKEAVLKNNIELVVVGPEEPLVKGIHDYFLAHEELRPIGVIGPQKAAAELEGSKAFAKEFMIRHQIPTAQYAEFTKATIAQGEAYLEQTAPPYVLKADGLAAGKGVVILEDLEAAKSELRRMLLEEKFGAASKKVVIEEFLSGIELSCFVLTDGNTYSILPMAKDYKRIGEGDIGLNTGGMGAVSPVPFVSKEFYNKIEDQIIKPTVAGLKKDGLPYKGFIFIGLIKVGEEPKVIEYNVRLGDPETEVVLPRLETDLVTLFSAVHKEELESVTLQIKPETATTVMAVSGGYPEAYQKGMPISGLEGQEMIFHAGTTIKEGTIVTDGGRVLAATSLGQTREEALQKSYEKLKAITFKGMAYRKDIGFDL
ncbi:MAG: phosphoribosylamine--glycine ligase [Flavobacteriaceae bacterium]|jgi:phosphoribosylamine--glycine ligase